MARNVSFVETSATFNVIVLSLCYKNTVLLTREIFLG